VGLVHVRLCLCWHGSYGTCACSALFVPLDSASDALQRARGTTPGHLVEPAAKRKHRRYLRYWGPGGPCEELSLWAALAAIADATGTQDAVTFWHGA